MAATIVLNADGRNAHENVKYIFDYNGHIAGDNEHSFLCME